MRLLLLAGALTATILGLWVIAQSFTEQPSAAADPTNAAQAALRRPSGTPGVQSVTGLALVAGGVIIGWMVLRKA